MKMIHNVWEDVMNGDVTWRKDRHSNMMDAVPWKDVFESDFEGAPREHEHWPSNNY